MKNVSAAYYEVYYVKYVKIAYINFDLSVSDYSLYKRLRLS